MQADWSHALVAACSAICLVAPSPTPNLRLKLASAPQRGAIVFGGGLDRMAAMDQASAEGYFVVDCGAYAELR